MFRSIVEKILAMWRDGLGSEYVLLGLCFQNYRFQNYCFKVTGTTTC